MIHLMDSPPRPPDGGFPPFLLAVAGVSSFLLAALGVGLMRRLARRRKILDQPTPRSLHSRPTPRGGGLVIVVLALVAVPAFSAFLPAVRWTPVIAYVIGTALMAGISWLDDLYSLSPWTRLGVHGVASTIVVAGCGAGPAIAVPILGELFLGWAAYPLAVLWLVAVSNAFNFMDGIDGMAGLQALVAATAWGAVGVHLSLPLAAGLGVVLAGASLGFLVHNWSPARIFMGDVGSVFLGFSLGAVPFLAAAGTGPGSGRTGTLPLLAVAFLWPFICDTGFTLLRRAIRGENVLQAHRSHLYQRLVLAGHSHRAVAVFYGGLAVLGALCGLAWLLLGWDAAPVAGTVGLGAVLWGSVRWRERVMRAGQKR